MTVQTGGRFRHAVSGGRGPSAGGAKGAAREARHSRSLDIAARIGLAGRGLVYLLIGVLAVEVAFGLSNAQTNRSGALGQIKDKPFGSVVLVILVVGFLGYAIWRLLDAAVGEQGESDQKKRTAKRLVSAGRGVVYLAIAGSTISFLTSGGGGSSEPAPWTARVMRNDTGRVLVGFVGLVVIGIGVGMIVRGVKRKFEEKLKTGRMGPFARRIAKPAGTVGYVVRGVVFGLVGVFVTKAAIEFDPQEAKGLDGTLRTLAGQAYGQWLLALCALGLALFGVYSFFEARYRRL
ncbi:conserved membrane hypothetical protein [Frankia canadensis]|uniref:DUF1206 domain-containing protein n=1 Tax=Frankia canadensis TaxID=1836972 RepID=A0A2I2KVH9_9ACTN|nr:DUF1206 domain-containing protein [Frankia canadensis]SNQ49677.1 conserved membrane hypothetical protein [Frankia canadensis]SOU56967.1 conserved membrane hypothetical protein [Frankia canadensis]